MEQTLIIKFYKSAGRGIQNMWIESENGGDGMRFEINSPEETGIALQKYLKIQDNLNKSKHKHKHKHKH